MNLRSIRKERVNILSNYQKIDTYITKNQSILLKNSEIFNRSFRNNIERKLLRQYASNSYYYYFDCACKPQYIIEEL